MISYPTNPLAGELTSIHQFSSEFTPIIFVRSARFCDFMLDDVT